MTEKLIQDALLLWATIDPIGTLALFAAITSGLEDTEKKRLALKAVVYSATILIGSIIIGQILLSAMGIRLLSLQVAGGVILFIFGIQMVLGISFKNASEKAESGHDLAVFPLAIPSIASPGAIIAAILLTDNYLYPVWNQTATAVILLMILGITYVFMLFSQPILRFIGKNGAAILVRMMGLILAALSVELTMKAFRVEQWLGISR